MAHSILVLLLLTGLTILVVAGIWKLLVWLGIEKPAIDETEHGVGLMPKFIEGNSATGIIITHEHSFGAPCNERCGEITCDNFDVSRNPRRDVSHSNNPLVSYSFPDKPCRPVSPAVFDGDDESVTYPYDYRVCSHDDPSWCDETCFAGYGFNNNVNAIEDDFTKCLHGIPFTEPCDICELDARDEDDSLYVEHGADVEDEIAAQLFDEMQDDICEHGVYIWDDCLDCWYEDMSTIEPITVDHNMPESFQEYQREINLTSWVQARQRNGI